MRNIKRAGILMVAAASALLISAPGAGADHGGPHCDQLPPNITPDHPDWHPSLDRDSDGVACEDDGGTPDPTPEPGTQPEPAPEPAPAPAPPAPEQPADLDCGDPGTFPDMPVDPDDDPHDLDGDGDGVGCESPPQAAPAEPEVAEPTFTG